MTLSLAKILIPFLFLALTACQSVAPKPAKEAPMADKATTTSEAVTPATSATQPEPAATTDKSVTPEGTNKNAVPAEVITVDTYVIQPGDLLLVDVWKERDLQRELRVRPDGGLNFPLIGDVVAAGKTVQQLQKDLSNKLVKYVPDPVITVAVKEGLGNKIYVIGKVIRPGEYVATRNMDVMQALTLAGGPNPYASVNKIKILRRINGEQKTFRFKYSRVEKGEDLAQNIILQGGDVIVVP